MRFRIDGMRGKTHFTVMDMQSRISSKGQVVIPKDIRDRLRLETGTPLEIIETADSVTFRRASPTQKLTFEEATARIRERVKYAGPRYSAQEDKDAIDEMFRTSDRY
ncbi:AbrB/MazE/SpoVT family DNA-binding domain-containing protein [Sphingomonas sp.]|uniref:AbrB/MazE/SpoVT family DNA-binding domain-containing protein n=1 Tax=Sphingomonas sp. TaxID=28214 RepID=UPI0025D1C555|nr:AbrB/MazE/SpoVT family DNA-binding domain-containing protein [Sphingomonas sp.]